MNKTIENRLLIDLKTIRILGESSFSAASDEYSLKPIFDPFLKPISPKTIQYDPYFCTDTISSQVNLKKVFRGH